MRELVLNHASLTAPDRHSALLWLKNVAVGMAELVREGIARSELRMGQPVCETRCHADWSLWDAYLGLSAMGARDESVFLLRLSVKVPLLSNVRPDIKARFHGCEAKTIQGTDGDALVFCAITDGIAVGFPSDRVWERDWVTVDFGELLSDGSIADASETIENLTRSAHARPICERHRSNLRQFKNFPELWATRTAAFPNLTFSPDVKNQLDKLNRSALSSVTKRLASLDESAGEWRISGGAMPVWKCKVTPESVSVMKAPKLHQARRFRSYHGGMKLFEWHARFGGSERIHLHFDADSQDVEIGYIGQHLPL